MAAGGSRWASPVDMWVSLLRCSMLICGAILAAAVYKHDSLTHDMPAPCVLSK
jgi:hypothetical protein